MEENKDKEVWVFRAHTINSVYINNKALYVKKPYSLLSLPR